MYRVIRVIMTVIGCAMLLWFIIPSVYGIFHIGNTVGIMISCAVIFRFGFAGIYLKLKAAMLSHMPTMMILRVIQTGAVAFIIYAIVVSSFMIYAMSAAPRDNATAVVLGAEVKPWGPSVLLRQRIDAAEKFMNDRPDVSAVVTGGKGSNEVMSEGQCMYDVMTADGIAPDRVFIEDKATNTYENIKYSLKIISENNLNSDIAIVSDSYHQLRARIIAKKADNNITVGAVNTKNNNIGIAAYPSYFVREWLAIPVEFFK